MWVHDEDGAVVAESSAGAADFDDGHGTQSSCESEIEKDQLIQTQEMQTCLI